VAILRDAAKAPLLRMRFQRWFRGGIRHFVADLKFDSYRHRQTR